ncbi:hypothetical protein JCM10213v2_002515 [Rhodosporidiobolus nylandii]
MSFPGPKKRTRGGLDTSLIIDTPRARKARREGSAEVVGHGGLSSGASAANVRARTQEEFENVRQQGQHLYDKLMAAVDPHECEIKDKLDTHGYVCLNDVRNDIQQIFVNAQRFNAKGSGIFLDAKVLKKSLKDAYSVLIGEAPPPDEDDIPVGPPSPHVPVATYQPSSSTPYPSHPPSDLSADITMSTPPTILREGEVPGTQFAKSGPTLKPWLTKKLAEIMMVADTDGRQLVEFFRTLPDRKLYPDYYSVINTPLAFDTIASRVTKRHYQDISSFAADVNLMYDSRPSPAAARFADLSPVPWLRFDNAMFYNEESSQIWRDAALLKAKFAELMKEPAPVFNAPRKYNMGKRRTDSERGSSAAPEDGYGSEYGSEFGETSRVGSEAPGTGYELPPKLEDRADPYALLTGLPAASPSLTPAVASPVVPSTGLTPLSNTIDLPVLPSIAKSGDANPLVSFASLSAFSPGSSPAALHALASPSTANGASSSRPPTSRSASQDVLHPRLVAKLPAIGEVPLVASFHVAHAPSTSPPLTLDNTQIRQHSFSVASSTTTLTFSPVFLGGSSSSAKGKEKDVATGNGLADALSAPPNISIRAKPASLPFAAVLSEDGEMQYILEPRNGLSVVEFVVSPTNARDGEGSEVYRCFVTK